MAIREELTSLRNFIASVMPATTKFHLQNMPSQYVAGEVAIDFTGDRSDTETALHYRVDTTYQIVYFGESRIDCVDKMDAIKRKLRDTASIQLGTKIGKLTDNPISVSQPFKTESGVYGIIGMLEVESRELKTQVSSMKIAEVSVSTENN